MTTKQRAAYQASLSMMTYELRLRRDHALPTKSPAALSKATGIPLSTIVRTLQGKTPLTGRLLAALATTYGLPLDLIAEPVKFLPAAVIDQLGLPDGSRTYISPTNGQPLPRMTRNPATGQLTYANGKPVPLGLITEALDPWAPRDPDPEPSLTIPDPHFDPRDKHPDPEHKRPFTPDKTQPEWIQWKYRYGLTTKPFLWFQDAALRRAGYELSTDPGHPDRHYAKLSDPAKAKKTEARYDKAFDARTEEIMAALQAGTEVPAYVPPKPKSHHKQPPATTKN